ncbi:MAG: hypothetical protein EA351_00280 [Gemmatimonadales bacterium]|nr:MAG: hypothetical protein EA351_00280 [Gemmatimonadales bacterium]
MKFLCDEGVERQVVAALRSEAHEVFYVAEMVPGISDERVLKLAAEESAILVTSDKDFGELVFRQHRAHQGVILLRLHGLDAAKKGLLAVAAVVQHGEQLAKAFSVVEEGRIRIRRGRIE